MSSSAGPPSKKARDPGDVLTLMGFSNVYSCIRIASENSGRSESDHSVGAHSMYE